jgi:hypothetical protein
MVLVCVVFLTLKPAFLRFLIAEASGLPTTEGTRGSGAATTRGTLEPSLKLCALIVIVVTSLL